MSADKITDEIEFIDLNNNNEEINNDDAISETEIIGLPRLEKVLNNIEDNKDNSLTLLSNNPVSLSDYYQENNKNKEKIVIENNQNNRRKKRNRSRKRRRSDLILTGKNNQEEKIEKETLISNEEIISESVETDNSEEKTIILSDISTVIDEETTEVQEENKEKLSTLIEPGKSRKRRKRRHHKKTETSKEISSRNTATLNTPIIQSSNNYIFSNIPDHLVNAGLILYNNLTKQMQENGTLRVEYLMTVLGSLAGYSTQAAVKEKMINQLKLSEDQVFSVIETADNAKYYFGDTIDRTLQKDKHSIWYMSATAALKLTGRVSCNINEIVRYNIRNLGKKTFGIPRIPKNLRTGNLPEYYVKYLWNPLQKGLIRFTDDPLDWPIIFGVALQRALITTKDVLDPNISLRIILESAVPTSMMEIVPLNPNDFIDKSDNKILIEKLRSDINRIRNTLSLKNLPDEQRSNLLNELSEKNEQLYQLLE